MRVHFISAISLLFLSLGCRSYRANIIFQLSDADHLQAKTLAEGAEKNYKVTKNDYLTIEVYTNHGERIIDPDFELIQNNQRYFMQERGSQQFLVMDNGFVKLPMIGAVQVDGLTLDEAEDLIESRFNDFYNDVFVRLHYHNKRIIVLGAIGGQVIPLKNENMNLLEVLALAGGVNDNARSYNIRLIRGNLDNPEVHLIDLSTIAGMKKANLKVMPGDIVYVEPVRRSVPETLRDISPMLSLFTTIITLFVLIRSL